MAKNRVSLKVCQADDCNNVFDTWGNQKFCSNACRQKQYRLDKKVMLKPAVTEKRHCRNCGNRFSCAPWSRREYCSGKCKQSFYRQSKNWAQVDNG